MVAGPLWIVDVQEASEYARENGVLYVETSAKSGMNVKQLFESIGTWHAACLSRPLRHTALCALDRWRCGCVRCRIAVCLVCGMCDVTRAGSVHV